MEMGRVEYTRVSSFSGKRAKYAEPSMLDEGRLIVAFRAGAEKSPHPHSVRLQMFVDRAEVDRDTAVGRRKRPEEDDFSAHVAVHHAIDCERSSNR